VTPMRKVPFWLFGVGGVGSTLLDILHDDVVGPAISRRLGAEFMPIMLADSKAFVADSAGLSPAAVEEAIACKLSKRSLSELARSRPQQSPQEALAALSAMRSLKGTIGIDATASDALGPALVGALDAGACVVLSNKRPLTASWAQFQALTRTRRLRHEATVGAGLPVISTLVSLLDSGDEITGIQGCFSGTLGFVCSALNRGEPYSQAVLRAVAAGYAEPDPREDLCGLDVARKALILSRLCGRALELNDLAVKPMIPARLDGLSQEEFMRRLPEADSEMAGMVQEAARRSQVLSYVAYLAGDKPAIGLRAVDARGPLGALSGTDNIVLFHTRRYRETPLVVQGPGAGRAVTAAGILTDMIALAREELSHE
jgi:homoserine dehydrogenase